MTTIHTMQSLDGRKQWLYISPNGDTQHILRLSEKSTGILSFMRSESGVPVTTGKREFKQIHSEDLNRFLVENEQAEVSAEELAAVEQKRAPIESIDGKFADAISAVEVKALGQNNAELTEKLLSSIDATWECYRGAKEVLDIPTQALIIETIEAAERAVEEPQSSEVLSCVDKKKHLAQLKPLRSFIRYEQSVERNRVELLETIERITTYFPDQSMLISHLLRPLMRSAFCYRPETIRTHELLTEENRANQSLCQHDPIFPTTSESMFFTESPTVGELVNRAKHVAASEEMKQRPRLSQIRKATTILKDLATIHEFNWHRDLTRAYRDIESIHAGIEAKLKSAPLSTPLMDAARECLDAKAMLEAHAIPPQERCDRAMTIAHKLRDGILATTDRRAGKEAAHPAQADSTTTWSASSAERRSRSRSPLSAD